MRCSRNTDFNFIDGHNTVRPSMGYDISFFKRIVSLIKVNAIFRIVSLNLLRFLIPVYNYSEIFATGPAVPRVLSDHKIFSKQNT